MRERIYRAWTAAMVPRGRHRMATLKKMTSATGYHACSKCSETIVDGSFYYREQGRYWHSTCPVAAAAAPVVAAPVVAASPVASDPVLARALAPHLAAGRLPVYGGPERLSDYEAEYENEGR
jgi:hypothetical protein